MYITISYIKLFLVSHVLSANKPRKKRNNHECRQNKRKNKSKLKTTLPAKLHYRNLRGELLLRLCRSRSTDLTMKKPAVGVYITSYIICSFYNEAMKTMSQRDCKLIFSCGS